MLFKYCNDKIYNTYETKLVKPVTFQDLKEEDWDEPELTETLNCKEL